MHKNLLPLIVLLTGFSIAAQTTPIPDANFEQDLVNQGIDTNGTNGNILDVDAQGVTNLAISRTDISNFTGLEAFTNLITLDLGRNNFLTAPLTTLTLLEEFIFDDNNILDNLDLTQNTNLRILNIGTTGSTGNASTITALDLSQNINLESAYIYAFLNLADISLPQTAILNNVQIIGTAEDIFDFTNHSGLEELWLNQNTSTTNITLPAVKTALKKLDIRNQRVNSVDLTGFIVLEDVNLGGTEVETLLLPTSTALKRLTIRRHKLPNGFSFASVPDLEVLHVESNLLPTTFDVNIASNTLIYDLDLSDNKMVNLDMTQNTLLTNVDVSNNEIPTFDSSQNVILKELNASRNNITTLDLSQNIDLETLNLNTNELPTIDLATNIELLVLNLGTNQLPNLDITTNTKITSLRIDDNLFTGTGLDLTQNVDLVYLNAEINQIESLDITQNLDLSTIILNHNLFPGTAILDQFYSIRNGDDGIRGGKLEVSHNLLTGQIPNFADLFHLGPADTDPWTRYFELTIDNNYFHFADLEVDHIDFVSYVVQPGAYNIPIIRKYNYAPQAKVNAIENPTPNAGESITLLTEVRGAQNHYQWFKDGAPIADATDSPEYTITDLNTCDNGVYHSEITSDLVPFENSNPPGTNGKNLLLVRNDITLTVNATKECVTLANPIDGATNVPINTGIEWNDNPGACGYKISVGTATGGTDIVNNEDVGEVTVYNFAGDLPSNATIFVTITPYFDDGDFAGCTEESFDTNTSTVVPDCTNLISTLAGSTNVPVDANIEWESANGADTYDISVGTTPGGTEIFTGDVGSTTTYDPVTDFSEGATIYVTITPINTVGSATGCIEESFTVETSGGPTVPPCTNLTAPADNANNIAITTDFTWNAASTATDYNLSIGTSSGGTEIFSGDVGNTTTYDHTSDLPEGTTIYVTIIPKNAQGDATGCIEESFTTETLPTVPPCTNLTTPADNATNVAITTNLTWNAAATATDYNLSIGTSSGGTEIFLGDVGGITTYDHTSDLPEGTTIYVTIIPKNAQGDATGCIEESFTTETLPTVPPCTNLTAPANNANNVAITTDLNWNAVATATDYNLSIGTSIGGTEIFLGDVGNTTTYDHTTDLPEGTNIYVTIIPKNAQGDATGCLEQSFTTSSNSPDVPACTNMIVPANDAENVAIDTNIEWNTVANAVGYRLTIGTTSGGTDIYDNEDVGILTSYTLAQELPFSTTFFVSITPYNSEGDTLSCSEQTFTTVDVQEEPEVPVIEDETKYGFSPDNDGINDFWLIDGIENHPENIVYIYNRWGDMVFQIEGYDNGSNVFRGEANNLTKLGASQLPSGTYFFRIQVSGETNLKKLSGYLVLKR